MNRLIVAAAMLAASASTAWAHHSYAMFDETKTFEVKGVVKELQWTNPHIWLEISVASGPQSGEWSFEGGAIANVKRVGFTKGAIKAGDVVTIAANPLRNGKKGGSLLSVTTADGRKFGGGGRAGSAKTNPDLVER